MAVEKQFYPACSTDDFIRSDMKGVIIEGEPIVIVKFEASFFALKDECTHEEAPLSEGYLDGDEIVCSWHGACYKIKTGKVAYDPAETDLKTYEVRIKDGIIEVAL